MEHIETLSAAQRVSFVMFSAFFRAFPRPQRQNLGECLSEWGSGANGCVKKLKKRSPCFVRRCRPPTHNFCAPGTFSARSYPARSKCGWDNTVLSLFRIIREWLKSGRSYSTLVRKEMQRLFRGDDHIGQEQNDCGPEILHEWYV